MKFKAGISTVIALLGLTLWATSYAQTTNPEFLAHFPAPSRIRTEIKGTDPIDTSARIMAAFDVLIETVQKLSGSRYKTNNNTPDEIRLIGRYSDALEPYTYKTNAPPPDQEPRWRNLRASYAKDSAFRDELFRQFFPPQFRSIYANEIAKSQTAAATSPVQAATGNATLTVTSGISSKPGVPNPLGGGPVVLLRGSAMPDLKQPQGVAQMKRRAVAEGTTDASGRITFSGLASGDYYVVLIALKIRTPITFGMPVFVKPGANTATIDQRHAGMGITLDAASRDTLTSILREASGEATCKAEDIFLNPDCINRQLEKQKMERQCPIRYNGPARKPGVPNASLSVIGTGYVYNYTERDRKTGVVTNSREIERGNFINTTLYLLDENAEAVMAEAGLSSGLFGELGVPVSLLMTFDMLDVEDVVFPSPGTRKELSCVMDGIKSHAVATMTTDANARGTFPNVPAGTYYVFGRYYRGGKRPAGGMFWNYKIDLKPGPNVLQLSVDKAVLK